MKRISKYLLIAFTILTASVCLAKTPIEIVNERMVAHNNHDIEKFLASYAEDIQIYDFPSTPLGSAGKAHLRKIFTPLFKNKAVKTKIQSQMENGKYVANRETVEREGKITEYISIYEIEDGLIKSVRFIKYK